MPILILHLSDLHFSEPASKGHYWNSEATELDKPEYDHLAMLGALCKDLRELRIEPAVVVVSGDLLERASSLGVPLATKFLCDLTSALTLPRTRVVLAPGNHDVIRGRTGPLAYEYYDNIRCEFYGIAPHGLDRKESQARVELFEWSELGLQVLAFNSCELLSAGKEEGAIVIPSRAKASRGLGITVVD
jgi:predicted MPP superfamily phosphohydrolase